MLAGSSEFPDFLLPSPIERFLPLSHCVRCFISLGSTPNLSRFIMPVSFRAYSHYEGGKSTKEPFKPNEINPFSRGNPEVQVVPLPVLLPSLPLNPVVPTLLRLPTRLTPQTRPNPLPSLTKPPRLKLAAAQACWPKWPPRQVPLPSGRPSDTAFLTCCSGAEGETTSPSNKVLPFNNSSSHSSSQESVVRLRPKVRALLQTPARPMENA